MAIELRRVNGELRPFTDGVEVKDVLSATMEATLGALATITMTVLLDSNSTYDEVIKNEPVE